MIFIEKLLYFFIILNGENRVLLVESIRMKNVSLLHTLPNKEFSFTGKLKATDVPFVLNYLFSIVFQTICFQ